MQSKGNVHFDWMISANLLTFRETISILSSQSADKFVRWFFENRQIAAPPPALFIVYHRWMGLLFFFSPYCACTMHLSEMNHILCVVKSKSRVIFEGTNVSNNFWHLKSVAVIVITLKPISIYCLIEIVNHQQSSELANGGKGYNTKAITNVDKCGDTYSAFRMSTSHQRDISNNKQRSQRKKSLSLVIV